MPPTQATVVLMTVATLTTVTTLTTGHTVTMIATPATRLGCSGTGSG